MRGIASEALWDRAAFREGLCMAVLNSIASISLRKPDYEKEFVTELMSVFLYCIRCTVLLKP